MVEFIVLVIFFSIESIKHTIVREYRGIAFAEDSFVDSVDVVDFGDIME